MNNFEFKRQHSHEYLCQINEYNYRMTKMANCQNWDIEVHDATTLSEYRYLITFTTLRECKDYLSEIHKVDII
jgi:hypothetical protein